MRSKIIMLAFCAFACFGSCAKKDDALRVGFLQSDLHHLPAFVALDKGFFEEQGLSVKIGGAFKAGPEEMSAFGAGELDFGYVGQAPATAAFLNRIADVQFLAQVNREGSAVVCRKGEAPDVKSLRGRTVAIPGHATMQDFLLRRALRSAGMTIRDIRPIVLKPPEMLQALEQRNIDAFIAWQPYPALAAGAHAARIIIDSSAIWPEHPCCILVAQRSLCAGRPEIIKKIRSAHERACAFIRSHQEESLEIAARYTSIDRSALADALRHIHFGGAADAERSREFVDFLKQENYIKNRAGADELFPSMFYK